MTLTVDQRLVKLADLFKERNAAYGSNYKHFGRVLISLFPDGLTLKTEEEFNRFALYFMIVHKVTRYAKAMPANGHEDSLDDIAVYAQLLQDCDHPQPDDMSYEGNVEVSYSGFPPGTTITRNGEVGPRVKTPR